MKVKVGVIRVTGFRSRKSVLMENLGLVVVSRTLQVGASTHYLRSVSETLLCCKSSSFSSKSSWCSSESTLPPTEPSLSLCNRPSLLALLSPSLLPPPASSSSSTSPKCSSPSREWLLDRNGLRVETEAREQHMQSRKKNQTEHEYCQQREKERQTWRGGAAMVTDRLIRIKKNWNGHL